MTVFVDTSALYALLDADDEQHARAAAALRALRERGVELVTHAYAVVETSALAQRRLPAGAQRALFEGLLAVVDVATVDPGLHAAAVAALLIAPSAPSLVDQVSFALMRERGIDSAFAFDDDFAKAGFAVVP